jgi:undecaprenyl-diphosphatase
MNIDLSTVQWLAEHRALWLNPIMEFVSITGNAMMIWIVVTLVFVAVCRRWKILYVFAGAYLASFGITEALKDFFARPRPYITDPAVTHLLTETPLSSMPSGHTSSSFVAAALLSHFFPRFRFAFYGYAMLIAFSRVYVGVHYPSDVMIGAFIGSLVAGVAIFIAKRFKLGARQPQ